MSPMSEAELAMLVEYGEADAWADYYLCAPHDFASQYRVAAKRVGSLWVTMISELDWTFFNRINCLGVGHEATEMMLDDAIAILEGAGNQNYMAQVSPMAQPAQLTEWLVDRGFERGRNWAKVYRGADMPAMVRTDLRVQVIGEEYAGAFAEVTSIAFEMPPDLRPFMCAHIGKPGWRHYLAFDGDQAVSAGCLYVKDDIGWLGFGSTLKSHRRRGGQGAIMAQRMRDGLSMGCKWFVTETGEDTPESPNPSYHNMLRMGFKPAYLRPNYVHQPTTG